MRSTEDMEAAAVRVLEEGAIPLSKLAAKIPAARAGKLGRLSTGALTRWIVEGKQGVYLDAARAGGRGWVTSLRAFGRFSAQLVAKESGGKVQILASPSSKERRASAADAELDQLRRRKVV